MYAAMASGYAAEQGEVDRGGGLVCGHPMLHSPTHGGGHAPAAAPPAAHHRGHRR